jgi:glycosyltransferase involved in cell wall biosynthesis
MIAPNETRPSVAFPGSSRFIGKRVAEVVYSAYPADPRPRRASEALAKEGAVVEVLCLRESDEEPRRETFNGVDITRLPMKRRRGGKLTYFVQYGMFILLAGATLAWRTCKRRYHLVHVHNMPDILVFSALVPKLLRAKVILDIHDPMPELMMTIFGSKPGSFPVWLLKELEKWSLRFADVAITTNEACRKLISARSCPVEKIRVVMNSPDETIFRDRGPSNHRLAEADSARPFVIMYHGTLVERHGLDLAVLALAQAKARIPNAELRVFGRSTPFLEQVMGKVQSLGLRDSVQYLGPKKLEQIVEAIGQCDVGIIPNRRSTFTELITPTRIFEFLCQGKPVIAPRAGGVLDYFSSRELILFELGDVDDLAAKMEYVFRHPNEVVTIVERGQEVYRAHRWASERTRFVSMVSALLRVTAVCLLLTGSALLGRGVWGADAFHFRLNPHNLLTASIRMGGHRKMEFTGQLTEAS